MLSQVDLAVTIERMKGVEVGEEARDDGEFLTREQLRRKALHFILVLLTSAIEAELAARRWARSTKRSSFPCAYNDNDPGSTIRACTHLALHFSRSIHVEPRIACGPGLSSSFFSGGYSTPSSTVKNVKPTFMSGSDSGTQLTSISPFNRVCKLQKRDATMSRHCTGITHKCSMSFMRAIHNVVYHP
jgi:hypothetical protein